MMFERWVIAGWGDRDFKPSHEKYRLFRQVGGRQLDYHRAVSLLEDLPATPELAALAADDSRFAIHNSFYRLDGQRVARVKSTGGWLESHGAKVGWAARRIAGGSAKGASLGGAHGSSLKFEIAQGLSC
jgi:hypothetical protein